jgi:hypothetical protein
VFFSSTKLQNKREEQVLSRGGGGGSVAQIMYTYVSKCKNYKTKLKKKDSVPDLVGGPGTEAENKQRPLHSWFLKFSEGNLPGTKVNR